MLRGSSPCIPLPELPDVEGFRRLLQRHGAGAQIAGIDVVDSGVIRGRSAAEFTGQLLGRHFAAPQRRGKWLLAPTDGPTLLFHFGMTGSLEWNVDLNSADRVTFALESGTLAYRDRRKLRGLWLAGRDQPVEEVIGPQGPDALGLTGPALMACFEGRRPVIKTLLMDQAVIAGLGNMLSDEVLWRAKVHPLRRFGDLQTDDRCRLDESLQLVLRAAVKQGRIPRTPSWLSSQRSLDEPCCPRCHRPLCTSRLAGRTSYWCPYCQAV